MSHAEVQFDVVVVGGTPGGIAAALSAGRAGRKVLLIEAHRRIGGMSASGLGKSTISIVMAKIHATSSYATTATISNLR